MNIDVGNMELDEQGELISSPIIELIGRCKPEEGHDHERHAAEVQAGYSDGQPGRILKDGTWREPNKTVAVSKKLAGGGPL